MAGSSPLSAKTEAQKANNLFACKPNEKLIPGAAFLHVNQMNLLG